MKIRVRPPEIKIPRNKPDELFENDLLDRKESIDVLTAVIRSIKGPCVMAVDAEWGAGKTTFLKLWAQHLRNEQYPVVEYNAWKTDFASHPFAALFDAMLGDLTDSRERFVESLRDTGTELIRSLGMHLLGSVGLGPVMTLVAKQFGESRPSDPSFLAEYQQMKNLLDKFKETLEKAASKLRDSTRDRVPLVVFVDELDRCRPSYAIELLEVAKHVFSVDDVVFVFGINQAQLKHSVSVLYGAGFDSFDYLRRFFDLEVMLPAPDRKIFVDRQLYATGLTTYFAGSEQSRVADAWLRSYLSSQDISVRSVAQFAHRAGLALAALPSTMWRFQWATVAALIIKTTDLEVYGRILTGTISDEEAYRKLRTHPSIASLPHPSGFEAAVIMACHDMVDARQGDKTIKQPLLLKHRERSKNDDGSIEFQTAKRICQFVEVFNRATTFRAEGFGFRRAVRRIELMSARESGLLQQQLTESHSEGGQVGPGRGQAASPALSSRDLDILRAAEAGPASRKKLLVAGRYSGRSGSFRRRLAHLVAGGLLEMTLPNKPTSPSQRYRLTREGRAALVSAEQRQNASLHTGE